MKAPRYLGDGVYAQCDFMDRLVLTTGNHDPEKADNIIILEAQVWEALKQYVKPE